MNRTAVFVLAFLLSACIPLPFTGEPTAAPTVNAQATQDVLSITSVAETLNALPSPTLVVAIDTLGPTATGFLTDTQVAGETATPGSSLTNKFPGTEAFTETPTATGQMTATATQSVTAPAQSTAAATGTEHPRFYGTLPPAIPYGEVALINKAKADVYVSLQCTTVDGYKTIIEYPVSGRRRVSAPAGNYIYVAWVGGREFQGSFHLGKGEELSITFNKDKVTFK